jgi:hypothetical protein
MSDEFKGHRVQSGGGNEIKNCRSRTIPFIGVVPSRVGEPMAFSKQGIDWIVALNRDLRSAGRIARKVNPGIAVQRVVVRSGDLEQPKG